MIISWRKILGLAILAGLFFGLSRCSSSEEKADKSIEEYAWNLPEWAPSMEIPEDNPMSALKVELGEKLFFDPILSRDSTISCSSCHKPELAFTDNVAFSQGVDDVAFRNAPSILNTGYRPLLHQDGGMETLEIQSVSPIIGHLEMANDHINPVLDRLNARPDFVELFQEVFGTDATPFGLSRALAAYERSLTSFDSPWDRFFYQADTTAVSKSAIRGYALFSGNELNCTSCHSGVFFTNDTFANNGLYEAYPADSGRELITLDPEDEGKFRVPSLRNVSLTAPYMHDGSLVDLSAVIDHYASGGSSHPTKSALINGFELNSEQKKDLIVFLESLTDHQFLEISADTTDQSQSSTSVQQLSSQR